MERYVLGIDIGSGSVKLTLLSDKGRIAGSSGAEYPTLYPHPRVAYFTRPEQEYYRTGAVWF